MKICDEEDLGAFQSLFLILIIFLFIWVFVLPEPRIWSRVEVIKTFYSKGGLHERYSVVRIQGNWVKHGHYEAWYPSGSKETERVYNRGLLKNRQIWGPEGNNLTKVYTDLEWEAYQSIFGDQNP
jgi:hypothetical protein